MTLPFPISPRPAELLPARIGPLARLPIFLELNGREALVAGGDAASAWKAELLASCGALVVVLAEEVSVEMMAVAAAQAGAVTIERRTWTPADVAGKAVAVGALEGRAAAAFHAAGRAAGVIVNVIDQPAHCDFTFGTIVNRSPVVIGISTDGAAPVLAQAIRRRIEVLIPETLAGWAHAAKRLRHKVAERLTSAAARRAFWERFVDIAFAEDPGRNAEAQLFDELGRTAVLQPKEGRMTLVGAGPGDAEHLTIKAVRALQQADVVIFDNGVSDGVLALARREAKRMMIGRPGLPRENIYEIALKFARDGRHVVRLKSGDPPLLGDPREIKALEAAGIRVDVVPGATPR